MQLNVLRNLYQAVLYYVLWVTAISPEVTSSMCLETQQQHAKRFRCKGSPAHPTAFWNFSMELAG